MAVRMDRMAGDGRATMRGAVGQVSVGGHRIGTGVGTAAPGLALPYPLAPGQKFWVDKMEFSYRGPAATLMAGIGWKPGTANFDSGAHLIKSPYRGYAFATGIAVQKSADYVTYAPTFANQAWHMLAPAASNVARDGGAYSYSNGRTFDVWFWLFDQALYVNSNPFPNDKSPGWLGIWNDGDGGVMKLVLA